MDTALLDLLGDPLRPPTRRERHRVATQRRSAPPPPAPAPAPSSVVAPAVKLSVSPVAAPAVLPPPVPLAPSRLAPALLELHPQLWRSSELGLASSRCLPSGFARLDAELPGGGWPTRALTELLLARAGTCEWRLLGPGLAPLTQDGRRLLLIGPPHEPQPRGLGAWGLPPHSLIWIASDEPQRRLWALEQALRADADEIAALLAWLPPPRAPQLRRLQTLAARCRAPVFVLHEGLPSQASAAPLRLRLSPGAGAHWAELQLEILKRRGPPPLAPLRLHAPPPTLQAVLPLPELERPPALPQALRALLSV